MAPYNASWSERLELLHCVYRMLTMMHHSLSLNMKLILILVVHLLCPELSKIGALVRDLTKFVNLATRGDF